MEAGEVWIQAGELQGQLPDGDDKEEGIEDDDETHRAEEAPDEAIVQGQPAAGEEKRNTCEWLVLLYMASVQHAGTSGFTNTWHLLLLRPVSRRSNAGRYCDDNKGHPIASRKQVEGPDCGVEDLDHHAVQLHSFQEHPGKDRQEEEMEHPRNKPAAALSATATHVAERLTFNLCPKSSPKLC